MKEKIFYKRNLPHYHPLNACFFVTFRIANSLPLKVINDIKTEFESQKRKLNKNSKLFEAELYKLNNRYFGKFDSLLDKSKYGHKWLKNEKIAKLIYDEILGMNNIDCDVITFSIMPNHVHLVFGITEGTRPESRVTNNSVTRDLSREHTQLQNRLTENNLTRGLSRENPYKETRVTQILRKLKGVTARESNKILNRQGQFWHHESYDHVVRDENEMERIVSYVLNNPVKAGFVENWYDWKWNYIKSD